MFYICHEANRCIQCQHMVAEWLQKLLILQDRDSNCDAVERQLDGIPNEIAAEEAAIRSLEEALKAKAGEYKALEVRRLDLEGEVEQAEANILKYKTQQMQVKKNEEYSALEKEISNLQSEISDLEDKELFLLEEIDAKKENLDATRRSVKDQRATLEAHIALLRQNYDSFAAELDDARKSVKDCEVDIDPGVLKQYRYVKGQLKRPPVVVPLEEGRCMGCHLKVSGEIETDARKGKELVRCDSCGRILYYDR